MDRLLVASFHGTDAPLGRFWKPQEKLNEMTVWSELTNDIVRGVLQCSEFRERLAAMKPQCVPGDADPMFDPRTEAWATVAVWAAYSFCSAATTAFGTDDIRATADPAITGGSHDGWKWRYHEWDVRDGVKIRRMAPFAMVLFSSALESWTAGLITAIKVSDENGSRTRRVSAVDPSLKNALLAAIEVARYVTVLALTVCEFRVPPGMPKDCTGEQIRECCAALQARRLLQRPSTILDGRLEGEEQYFRALYALVGKEADYVSMVGNSFGMSGPCADALTDIRNGSAVPHRRTDTPRNYIGDGFATFPRAMRNTQPQGWKTDRFQPHGNPIPFRANDGCRNAEPHVFRDQRNSFRKHCTKWDFLTNLGGQKRYENDPCHEPFQEQRIHFKR